MPEFRDFAHFERELAALARDVQDAERQRITELQAEAASAIAAAEFSSVLGGDPKFSGWAPELETQTRPARDRGTLLTPTRTSAGPITVVFVGRNRGNAAGFAGPGLNTRTGRTSYTGKVTADGLRNVRKRKTKARRWTGVTDPKLTVAGFRTRVEHESNVIAGRRLKQVTRKRFDTT